MPPLGFFILPLGVAGKGGKCLRMTFVLQKGLVHVLYFLLLVRQRVHRGGRYALPGFAPVLVPLHPVLLSRLLAESKVPLASCLFP